MCGAVATTWYACGAEMRLCVDYVGVASPTCLHACLGCCREAQFIIMEEALLP